MVEIKPFKGIQYVKDNIESMEDLITQPYDKISEEMQQEYYESSEYNYCRLILPLEEDRYSAAAERLNEWLRKEILRKEDGSGIYVYYQDFEVLGNKYTRKGFISAAKLHPFEEDIVLPHEETHEGPKMDRLKMLRATEKNLEAGFMLYSDEEKSTIDLFDAVAEEEPLFEATDIYGVHNRVWKIEDEDKVKEVKEVLDGEQVVIADGHHRYETAVNYRDEMREKNPDYEEDEAFNWRMTFMVPVEDPGLVVLPGHRLLLKEAIKEGHLEELEDHFETQELSIDEAQGFLEKNEDMPSFAVYDGEKTIGLRLRDMDSVEHLMPEDVSDDYKELDVVVLRKVIFEEIMDTGELKIDEGISYERWEENAVDKVKGGDAEVAFLVNATDPEEVLSVAKNGERMPQKSTDFYPKADSGFMMMDIQGGEML